MRVGEQINPSKHAIYLNQGRSSMIFLICDITSGFREHLCLKGETKEDEEGLLLSPHVADTNHTWNGAKNEELHIGAMRKRNPEALHLRGQQRCWFPKMNNSNF